VTVKQSDPQAADAYAKTTRNILVSVEPVYLEHDSMPENGHYLWAYHVTVKNNGTDTVQLMSRYWHITDGRGGIQEVRGDGVIGEQPILKAGDSYQYTSGTPLATPSGIMTGTYHMVLENGEGFDIDIPAFSLDSPFESVSVN